MIYAVACRAGADPGCSVARLAARCRVRTIHGSWAAVEGAALHGAQAGGVAITIRAATPAESFDLLCRVHGLTPRERQLAKLAIDGLTTGEIAERLVISPYTVKDHLKSIFEKTGARGRRELLAGISANRRGSADADRPIPV